MIVISYEGPTCVHVDNQSVLSNTPMPESTLKKESSSLAYHLTREGVATYDWRIACVNDHNNEAYLLTKVLPLGDDRSRFVRNVLTHTCDSS